MTLAGDSTSASPSASGTRVREHKAPAYQGEMQMLEDEPPDWGLLSLYVSMLQLALDIAQVLSNR